MSSGFIEFFGITLNCWRVEKKSVCGREGTERCPVYVGPRFESFCVLLLEK